MATTTPDNIYYPTTNDNIAPLETVLANMSTSTQTAISSLRTNNAYSRFATLTALNAAPGTQVGQHATVYADSNSYNNGDYYWTGSSWSLILSDTGFIAPSSITYADNFAPSVSPNGVMVRRVGKIVEIIIVVVYSGPTLTAGSTANFADTSVLTINDAALKPLPNNIPGVTRSRIFTGMQDGLAPYMFSLNDSGLVQLLSGTFPGQQFNSSTRYIIQGTYTV